MLKLKPIPNQPLSLDKNFLSMLSLLEFVLHHVDHYRKQGNHAHIKASKRLLSAKIHSYRSTGISQRLFRSSFVGRRQQIAGAVGKEYRNDVSQRGS
jgi:hypothetical protein